MANQPTKYRKFVVGAASAALVASAVAPVAFAADFSDTKGNTHEEAINALSEAGVIKGYEDGTFKPNKTLTRSDVVKLMGKWLVSEGYKVPTDAQSKPRFADLKSTSNKELLEMAAVVYDNGVFVGTPDGKLDPTGDITRENMAIVLVRAFDRVHDIDLASYVADQDFKKDVTDLGKAKAEARPAIDVLDFFDITNPAAPEFNPKATTTRGHFATFLHKTINADFSDVEGGVVTGVASVKAVNNTTVEVAFKEEVKNVDSLKFTIDGLTVSNAAVKQTDKKVVVLTTAVQKGGEKYTVTLDNKAIGSFTGVSSVVPTKITVTNDAVQGIVGKQVILTADIGVKEAGVPVTFNVAAGSKLNSDHVEEVTTNADGIATYSYTQYVAGYSDDVAVYPTGAPATRAVAKVFWGVDTILSITSDDEKSNVLNNGESKIYKVTYKDAKTGKPVEGRKLNVTFKENVDVTVDKLTKATVNGVTPYQLSNGSNPVPVQVTTNSKGEATFTVTGTNTKATPVVFVDENVGSTGKGNDKLDGAELQVSTNEVTFAAQQASYDIEVIRDGNEEAAVNTNNDGRKYKVVVKTKDGKVAANETVNVAFNEDIDRNINTITSAKFIKLADTDLLGTRTSTPGYDDKQITLKLNSKGEGEFVIASTMNTDYATPVVWLDINTNNNTGKLDEGEPSKVADKTYFVASKLTSGTLKAINVATGKEVKEDKSLSGSETARFEFKATNQNGTAVPLSSLKAVKASYTVFNTGDNDVEVKYYVSNASGGFDEKTITVQANRSETVQSESADNTNNIKVTPKTPDTTTNVRVEATATATTDTNATVYLGNKTSKVSFVSSRDVGESFVGTVESINTDKEEIKFTGKKAISYKGAKFVQNGANIPQSQFEKIALNNGAQFSYNKDKDGNVTFTVFEVGTADTVAPTATAKYNTLVNPVTPKKATAKITVGTDELVFTATEAGEDYNDIKIDLVNNDPSSTETTASVAISGGVTTITVELEDDGTDVTATFADVIAAVNSVTNITKLSAAAEDTTVVAAIDSATTAGGATEVAAAPATLVLTFDEPIANPSAVAIQLAAGKTLGTAPEYTWSADKKVLTIKLGAGATVAQADVISSTGAKDAAGNTQTGNITIQ
ncbi:S-layer homology domain-containing protein [Sporosarcina sp. FSL W7-1283]|uniref:S-layer homology domain-containing protein n=1 Tax=Sporosarcina sp. FSL W7-1283 TaxID=2921560 RepID=UPI0030FBC62F